MLLDVDIASQNLSMSPGLKERIESEVKWLEKYYPGHILHARVELCARPHHRPCEVDVKVAVAVPGARITASQTGDCMTVLIGEVFDVVRRGLLERSRVRQRLVKRHDKHVQRGTVSRLFPDRGYGFVRVGDSDVYFAAPAVKNSDFGHMKVGQKVRFWTEAGIDGPQATWVRPA